MIDINIDLEHAGTRALWRAVGGLVSVLPVDWVLIGGLMVDQVLHDQHFEMDMSDPDGYAWRYTRDGLVVDVLAPDGFKNPPKLGGVKALGVPGGQQALSRAERVRVTVDGKSSCCGVRRCWARS
jgi:hypothetical protein